MNWHKEWALPSIGHSVPPLGGMKVSWPPTFQKSRVSNSVPHLWKAVDLWEGACMEASINFQNVTGLDNNTLFPSPCALECFPVKRPRSNLSSLVSSSRSFLHPCLSLQTWTKHAVPPSLSHPNCHVFNICQGLHLQWYGPHTQKWYWTHEKWSSGPFPPAIIRPISPSSVAESYRICV